MKTMTAERRRLHIQECISWANQLLSTGKDLIILDAETTGLGYKDQILEIAIIDQEGNPLIDTLVKPSCPIRKRALTTHRISKEMLTTARPMSFYQDSIEEIIRNKVLVTYNLEFDVRMLMQSAPGINISPSTSSCLMLIYAQFHGEWNHARGSYRWQSLNLAAKRLNIKVPGQYHNIKVPGQYHRALTDARVSLEVLKAIAKSENG